MTGFLGDVIISETTKRGQQIINHLSTSEDDAVDFRDDENLYNALTGKVNVDRVGALKGRNGVASDSLSHKWFISPEAARRTVHNTTQQWIRTIIHSSLSRQFKSNDQTLSYNRIQNNVFTDTMQTGTVFRKIYQYAQVYSTELGSSRAHPTRN